MTMKINILGTEYEVKLEVPYNIESLEGLDGWTDDTSKKIVVSDCKKTNYDKPQDYKNKVLLHELVHSFLHECGLSQATCDWHTEEMVEWCATMIPKIMRAYESVLNVQNIDISFPDGRKKTIEVSK